MTSIRDKGGAIYVRTALLLASLLIANPVILYLMTGRVGITLVIVALCIAAVQGSYVRFGTGLPTVYLMNFLALGGIFAHAEVLIDYRFRDYVIEDLYHIRHGYYFNRPLLRTRLTDKEYAADYLTNADGYRIGYSQQVDRTYHTVDWLFLGDSYTQGAQVQFEELYTSLLYRKFPDRIIANVGISGFGLPEELAFFRHQGRGLKPRIVFLQLCNFNDFMKVQSRDASFSDYLVQYSDFARFLLQNIKYQNPATLPLGRWTEPFYPDEPANRRFNIFYTDTSPEKERDIVSFGTYLALLRDSVRAAGAELVVILLPTKEQVRPRYLEEVVRSFSIDPRKLDMGLPNAIAHRLSDSLGVPILDLLETFQQLSGEVYFEYDEHLTPYGHQVLAETVAGFLMSRGETQASEILSTSYEGDRYPSYSRGSAGVLYQSPADGNMELFLADTSFSAPRRLTYNDVDDSHPTMAPAGDRLAFTRGSQDSGTTHVVVSGPDGASAAAVLPSQPGHFGAIPSFSPDGSSIAYAEWAFEDDGNTLTKSRIVLTNLKTGESRAVTDTGAESWRPVFSPDGRQLAYISKTNGQFDLYLLDLASGHRRRLTDSPYDEWDPSFSYAGDKLVYAGRAEGNWDLFVINLREGQTERLTTTRGDEWDPSFSPNGKVVIYAGEFGVFRGIYLLSLEGGRR